MKELAEVSGLLDLYGNLLTDKQRDVMDLYFNYDLSLQEIAENEGISRQGVHDLIKRSEHALKNAEDKLRFKDRLSALELGLLEVEADIEYLLKTAQDHDEIVSGLANLKVKIKALTNSATGG